MNILNVSPYGVYPPTGGGFIRIYNLNLELSKYNKIFLFSQGIRRFELEYPLKSWATKINENYTEYRFVNKLSLSSSYFTGFLNLPPIFTGDVLKILNPTILIKELKTCDLVIVEHPWQFEYIHKFKPNNVPLILDEQNVEFDLLSQSMKSSLLSKKIGSDCKKKEQYAVENADAVFTTSQTDMDQLVDYFNVSKNKFYVIPNGVNTSAFSPSTEEEKNKIKKMMNLDGKRIVLFTGYKHPPNTEAVHAIQDISRRVKNKDIVFLVAGRVGESFISDGNLLFTGYVDNMSNYFKIADIAINPMISGSGTNLKILEYLACGIPTVTTKVGARGLEIENGKHAIISEIEDFPKWINILLEDSDLHTKLKTNGRELVVDKYDWKQIAKKQFAVYEKLLRY